MITTKPNHRVDWKFITLLVSLLLLGLTIFAINEKLGYKSRAADICKGSACKINRQNSSQSNPGTPPNSSQSNPSTNYYGSNADKNKKPESNNKSNTNKSNQGVAPAGQGSGGFYAE